MQAARWGSNHECRSMALKLLCLAQAGSKKWSCFMVPDGGPYNLLPAALCPVPAGATLPPAVLLTSTISSSLTLPFLIPLPLSQASVSVRSLGLVCCCPGARNARPRRWSCLRAAGLVLAGSTVWTWPRAQSSAAPNRSPCFLSKNMIRGLKLSRQLVYSPRAASVSGPPLFLSKSYLIAFQKRSSL